MVASGVAGYTARGIVIGSIAFLTFKTAFNNNSDDGGGTKEAFDFLQHEFGTIILAVIAFGLVLYGIFMLIKARHERINL